MIESDDFDSWAVLELMGHRRLAGRVRAVKLAGAAFLRIDVPADGDHVAATQFYAPGSVYAITPVTEEVARAVAVRSRPEPVSVWELPARASAPSAPAADPDDWRDPSEDDGGIY